MSHDLTTASQKSGLRSRWSTYRAYRNTLSELSSLSDRELNDLGLNRGSLRSVALEAHYTI